MSFIISNMLNLENLNGIKVIREELVTERSKAVHDTSLTESGHNSRRDNKPANRLTRKDRRKSVNVHHKRKSSLKEDSYEYISQGGTV